MGKSVITALKNRICLKKAIIYLLTVVILSVSWNGKLFAQVSQQDLFNVFAPSPEAASLAKFGEIPVNLYAGIPNITLPIYTFKLRDFSLPVRLRYNYTGMKVDEIASSVGYGWALEAGGVIAATVHGLPDGFTGRPIPEEPWLFNPDYYNNKSDYDIAQGVIDGVYDVEPDEFFYNFAGRSGKFVTGTEASKFYPIPYRGMVIEKNSNGFLITDENGVKYEFYLKGSVFTSQVCEGGQGHQSISDVSPPEVSSGSWYLTRIVTPNGSEIQLNYESYGYTYEGMPSVQKYELKIGYGCASIENRECTPTHQVFEKRLASIYSPATGVKVRFFYESSDRKDLPGANALKSIKVYHGDSQVPATYFNLTHDYFYADGYNSSDPQEEQAKESRLKLISLTERDTLAYKFTYNSAIEIPARGSFG